MNVHRFRKRPVEIEAVQVGGDPADGSLVIRTLEGDMRANPGDWIIRGVAGELYPCRQDIFEQTYEPARCMPEPDSDLKEES